MAKITKPRIILTGSTPWDTDIESVGREDCPICKGVIKSGGTYCLGCSRVSQPQERLIVRALREQAKQDAETIEEYIKQQANEIRERKRKRMGKRASKNTKVQTAKATQS